MNIVVLQDFTSNTSLSDNFTQSGSTSRTFARSNNAGLNSSADMPVSLGSNQVWTSKQGYTISDSGEHAVLACSQSMANDGYGAPGDPHLGAFFHRGGGLLNNGPIETAGVPTISDTPMTWNNGGVLPAFLSIQGLRVTTIDNFQIDWVKND